MAGTLTVQNIQGPSSGANANKIIIPAGQTLDASAGFVPPAGSVVQVVRTTWSTDSILSSTSFVDTGRSATITPTASSSKILIVLTTGIFSANLNISDYVVSTFYRNNTTNVGVGTYSCMMLCRTGGTNSEYTQTNTGSLIDSPSTTSSITYNYWARTVGGNSIYYSDSRMEQSITLMEIAQ